jgi:hypothetical protein
MRHIFHFEKHAMTFLLYGNTSFESLDYSYWFLKNSSCTPAVHRCFNWKFLYSDNVSIKNQFSKVPLTASFRRSKVRQNLSKIENLQKLSKCFKNRKKNTKLPTKRVPSYGNWWQNNIIYSQLRDLTICFCSRSKIFKNA